MRADTKNFVQTTNVIVGSMSVGLLSGYVIKSSLPDGLGGSWVLSGASSFDVYVTLMAVVVLLGLALVNRDARLKGQLAVSKRQELEIDLQRKAMDIHSIVIVSNPDGIISSVNQKFCDTLGFTEADVVGKPTNSFTPFTKHFESVKFGPAKLKWFLQAVKHFSFKIHLCQCSMITAIT
jgi:PAS domain-containing protein